MLQSVNPSMMQGNETLETYVFTKPQEQLVTAVGAGLLFLRGISLRDFGVNTSMKN